MKNNNYFKLIIFAILIAGFSISIRIIKNQYNRESNNNEDFLFNTEDKSLSINFPSNNIMKDSNTVYVNNIVSYKLYTYKSSFEDNTGFEVNYIKYPMDISQSFKDKNIINSLIENTLGYNIANSLIYDTICNDQFCYYFHTNINNFKSDYLICNRLESLVIAKINYLSDDLSKLNILNKDKYLFSIKLK